jgi:hypothetical protein
VTRTISLIQSKVYLITNVINNIYVLRLSITYRMDCDCRGEAIYIHER